MIVEKFDLPPIPGAEKSSQVGGSCPITIIRGLRLLSPDLVRKNNHLRMSGVTLCPERPVSHMVEHNHWGHRETICSSLLYNNM